MASRLIFVSCGQRTDSERSLGRKIKAEIDSTEGFEAYFADEVQELTTLGEHILDALRRCSGAVLVLHPRGRVVSDDGTELGTRSSVWVNQEVAILAYRQFFEGDNIPILALKSESVSLEGAMTALIVNPRPLHDDGVVVAEVREWMGNEAARMAPSQQKVFERIWAGLTDEDKDLLAALIDVGGMDVKEVSVRCALSDSYGYERNAAAKVVLERRLPLGQQNLIRLKRNIYDGDEMSLHLSWRWWIRHAVARQRR